MPLNNQIREIYIANFLDLLLEDNYSVAQHNKDIIQAYTLKINLQMKTIGQF